jgi:signal transduction histidine kinase
LLAISTLVAAVGGVAATWWIADREFREVLDEDLSRQADLLAELVADEGFGLTSAALAELLADAFESDDPESLWVTVYDRRDGSHVSNFEHSIAFDVKEEGSVDLRLRGHLWHGFREDEDHFVVQLMRRADLYRAVQGEVLEDIVMPAVIGSTVNLVLLALLIGFFLWPMTRLARQIEARSATSLAPLTVRTPAREIRLLRDAMNGLMRDVGDVLQRERRFASDVAHEMRTPLTTLKLELAGDEPDLAAVRSELDRLGRLVEQLLTLARLEQGRWHERFEPVSLDEVCGRAAGRLEGRFADAGMALQLQAEAATVVGDATLLEILLRNLLQNVLTHCPRGTRAEVDVTNRAGRVLLRVGDTGTGLAEDVRRQMSQDFSRLDSKGEGLGLGLAICHRIAEVHGAGIAFLAREDGARGLVVQVSFPA